MGVDANPVKTVRLYLRLPVKIIDEVQIKDLHPGIVKVTLPRQKSRRWCFVDFDSATTPEAIKALKTVRVDGKKVYVKGHRTRKDKVSVE